MKTTLAVIVGYLTWTAIWLGGNAAYRALGLAPADATQKIDRPRTLLALLALSFMASLVGGYVTALLSPGKPAAAICAGLLLATGIAVQWSIRTLLPGWYHAAFLILLVPLFHVGRILVLH